MSLSTFICLCRTVTRMLFAAQAIRCPRCGRELLARSVEALHG